MSSNAERLAEAVKARRKELDLTQLEVHAAGGPSNTTQTTVEGGLVETLSRTTARKLDAGLQWEPGSAKTVWLGGEPTPLVHAIPQYVLEEVQHLSPQARDFILKRFAIDQAREEGGTG